MQAQSSRRGPWEIKTQDKGKQFFKFKTFQVTCKQWRADGGSTLPYNKMLGYVLPSPRFKPLCVRKGGFNTPLKQVVRNIGISILFSP